MPDSIQKTRCRIKDKDGNYLIYYLKTSADQVLFTDGKNFQEKLEDGSLKGADGLTTSITVNGSKYTHVNGNITLPEYPKKLSDLEDDTISKKFTWGMLRGD